VADNTVSVDVELAIKKATADLEKLTGRFDTFASKAEKGIGGVDKKLGFMRLSLANLAGDMAGKALAAVTGFAASMVRDGIKAAQGYEDALTELNTALQLSGNYSAKASKDFEDYAAAIQATTKYSDDAVLSAGALIANISGLSGGALQKATQQAIDLSAALGKDLGTTAQLVGKVMVGETGTLSKYGIVIGEAGSKAEKTARAIEALAKFNGAAEKQAQTYSGAVEKLKNNYGDLQKQIGFFVTQNPAVIQAINITSGLFSKWASNVQGAGKDTKLTGEILRTFGVIVGSVFLVVDPFWRLITAVGNAMAYVWKSTQAAGQALSGDFSGALDTAKSSADNFKGFFKDLGLTSEGGLSVFGKMGLDVIDATKALKDFNGEVSKTEAPTIKPPEPIEPIIEAEKAKQESFLETLLFQTSISDQKRALDDANAALDKARLDKDVEATLKATEAKAKAEKAFRNAQVQGTMTALGTIATLQNSTNRELFFIGKAAAIAQATISAFQGAASALASVPYPYNFVAAGLVGAAGLAQVANIASTQPGFETGGIVGGNSMSGDNVPIRVNSREAVMTLDQQQRLFDIANGGASAGGGGITVIVEGNVIADSPSRIDELAERISERVRFNNTPLYASRMV
jgi:hypothetical protein